MKKILFFMSVLSLLIVNASEYKTIKIGEGATIESPSKEISIPDEKRPMGFIIRQAKEDMRAKAPMDSDGDGVLDGADKCPDTPRGKVVDEDGCMKLIRLRVNFDFDKYEIKDEFLSQIQEAYDFYKINKNLSIAVDGHTDSDGSEAYNQKLSGKRAAKVATKLINMGVDKENIQAQSHGELKPLVPNSSKENKAQNRRVDITFDKDK
ncbi:MAG: OmpA family protein [Sulfurospirillum sp.]|nr:OmpA family protein [Sulfurospirillum sp.]